MRDLKLNEVLNSEKMEVISLLGFLTPKSSSTPGCSCVMEFRKGIKVR